MKIYYGELRRGRPPHGFGDRGKHLWPLRLEGPRDEPEIIILEKPGAGLLGTRTQASEGREEGLTELALGGTEWKSGAATEALTSERMERLCRGVLEETVRK